MSKLRIPLGIIIVIALSALGYWAYLNYLAPIPPTPTPGNDFVEEDSTPTLISAEGRVVPVRYTNLSLNTPGRVETVLIEKGELVQKDALLARLEDQEQLEAALAAADLEMISAQQDLDELYENSGLAKAGAQQALAQARDVVQDAERLLNNLNYTPGEETIEAAEAGVALAQHAVDEAQKKYNKFKNKPPDNPKRAAARLALEATKKAYNFAVRQLNYLTGTPNEIEFEKAEANLALAQAQLDDAEREYEALLGGPNPDDLILAEARLSNAEAQLEASKAALKDLELRAPFAGTVISMDLKVGEFFNPSVPVLLLADLSSWQVDTTDLSESDVALLEVGMGAIVTLDAFPDQTFKGVIHEISLLGEDQRGSVTYTVSVDFDPGNTPVRWRMTAFIDITLP
jgi:multidrug resistance efflux pump